MCKDNFRRIFNVDGGFHLQVCWTKQDSIVPGVHALEDVGCEYLLLPQIAFQVISGFGKTQKVRALI